MRRMKNTFSAAPNQSEQWLPVGDQLPVRKDSDWLEQETFEQISSDASSPNIGAFAEPTIRRRLKIKTEIYSAPTVDWFSRQLATETAGRGGFLWLPVCLGIGGCVYFNLPREPYLPAILSVNAILVLIWWKQRLRKITPVIIAMALICAGWSRRKSIP